MVMLCMIWCHFCKLKALKKPMEECNCTKSITTPSVFFTLLNWTNGTKSSKASHISWGLFQYVEKLSEWKSICSTTRKKKFPIKDLFSKWDQIRSKLSSSVIAVCRYNLVIRHIFKFCYKLVCIGQNYNCF